MGGLHGYRRLLVRSPDGSIHFSSLFEILKHTGTSQRWTGRVKIKPGWKTLASRDPASGLSEWVALKAIRTFSRNKRMLRVTGPEGEIVGAPDTVVFQGKSERTLSECADVNGLPFACLRPAQAEQGDDDLDFVRVVRSLHPFGPPKNSSVGFELQDEETVKVTTYFDRSQSGSEDYLLLPRKLPPDSPEFDAVLRLSSALLARGMLVSGNTNPKFRSCYLYPNNKGTKSPDAQAEIFGQEFFKEIFEDLHLLVSVSGGPLTAELRRGINQTPIMKIKSDAVLAFLRVLVGWDAIGDVQDVRIVRKFPSFVHSLTIKHQEKYFENYLRMLPEAPVRGEILQAGLSYFLAMRGLGCRFDMHKTKTVLVRDSGNDLDSAQQEDAEADEKRKAEPSPHPERWISESMIQGNSFLLELDGDYRWFADSMGRIAVKSAPPAAGEK